jgi:hypothetical protein
MIWDTFTNSCSGFAISSDVAPRTIYNTLARWVVKHLGTKGSITGEREVTSEAIALLYGLCCIPEYNQSICLVAVGRIIININAIGNASS